MASINDESSLTIRNRLITLLRYAGWIIPAVIALAFIGPGREEVNTILLIVAIECISIGMSSLALWAYTQIDFTKNRLDGNIGSIFLGVHICTGLCVLGFYIAQFSN